MTMDSEDLRTPECPGCGFLVHDYEPGVSSKKVDGLLYHPDCAPPCTHPNAKIVETSSGYPADTGITRYRCFDCGATYTEELTMAEMKALQDADRKESESQTEARLLGRTG